MNRWLFLLLGLSLAAWLAMLFASETTRSYALHTLHAGDSAFTFYDDYPLRPDKLRLPYALVLCCGIGLLAGVRILRKESSPARNLIAVACGASVLIYWPLAMLAAWIAFMALYPWHHGILPRKDALLACASLATMALAFRLEKLPNVWNQPIPPDARSITLYGMEAGWFYDSNYREPVWCAVAGWLAWLFPPELLSGENDMVFPALRCATVLLSYVSVGVVFLVGQRIFNHQTGALAAMLMCANHAMVYRSLQGLRFELYAITLLLLVLSAVMLMRCRNRLWMWLILLGGSIAVAQLTRTSTFLLIGFVLAWLLVARPGLRPAVFLTTCIAVVACLPYYVYCGLVLGDPMISSSRHIAFYYQAVFGQTNPSDIPGTGELILTVIGLPQALLYSAEGTLEALFGRYALRLFYGPFSPLWIFTLLVALLVWLRRRELFWPLLLMFNLGPMLFFLGWMNHTVTTFDWRLMAHHMPFAALVSASGWMMLWQPASANTPAEHTPDPASSATGQNETRLPASKTE